MSQEQVYQIGDKVAVYKIGEVVGVERDFLSGCLKYKVNFSDGRHEYGTAFLRAEVMAKTPEKEGEVLEYDKRQYEKLV